MRGRDRTWSLSPGQSLSLSLSQSPSPSQSSQRLGINATFKVTPGIYQQLLIVNARIGGEKINILRLKMVLIKYNEYNVCLVLMEFALDESDFPFLNF